MLPTVGGTYEECVDMVKAGVAFLKTVALSACVVKSTTPAGMYIAKSRQQLATSVVSDKFTHLFFLHFIYAVFDHVLSGLARREIACREARVCKPTFPPFSFF